MKYSIYDIIHLAIENTKMGCKHATEVKKNCIIFRIGVPIDTVTPKEEAWHRVTEWEITDSLKIYISRMKLMFWVYCEGDITLTCFFDSKSFDKEVQEFKKNYRFD